MSEDLQNLIHLLTQMSNESYDSNDIADVAYREGIRRALLLAMNPGLVTIALTSPESKYFIKRS